MKLKLFRGLSLAPSTVEGVIQDIKDNGINILKDSHCQIEINDFKNDLEILFNEPNLSREKTQPSIWVGSKNNGYSKLVNGEKVICFADSVGAAYYAKRHNITKEKTIPVLIEIEEDIENIFIDGRDFLYTCFQNIDTKNKEKYFRQKETLIKIFGNDIVKYLNKIQDNASIDKIALCDLVIQDNEIIKNHYENNILIQGRYNTIFHSAFFVKTPILNSKVKKVEILDTIVFNAIPELTLNDFLER